MFYKIFDQRVVQNFCEVFEKFSNKFLCLSAKILFPRKKNFLCSFLERVSTLKRTLERREQTSVVNLHPLKDVHRRLANAGGGRGDEDSE